MEVDLSEQLKVGSPTPYCELAFVVKTSIFKVERAGLWLIAMLSPTAALANSAEVTGLKFPVFLQDAAQKHRAVALSQHCEAAILQVVVVAAVRRRAGARVWWRTRASGNVRALAGVKAEVQQ